MTDEDLAKAIEEAYRRYYLAKAENNPTSGYVYATEVTKFVRWLKKHDLPVEEKI